MWTLLTSGCTVYNTGRRRQRLGFTECSSGFPIVGSWQSKVRSHSDVLSTITEVDRLLIAHAASTGLLNDGGWKQSLHKSATPRRTLRSSHFSSGNTAQPPTTMRRTHLSFSSTRADPFLASNLRRLSGGILVSPLGVAAD